MKFRLLVLSVSFCLPLFSGTFVKEGDVEYYKNGQLMIPLNNADVKLQMLEHALNNYSFSSSSEEPVIHLNSILSEMNFGPTEDAYWRIRACTQIIRKLVERLRASPPESVMTESLKSIKKCHDVFVDQIDQGWNPEQALLGVDDKDETPELRERRLKNDQQHEIREGLKIFYSQVALLMSLDGQKGLSKQSINEMFTGNPVSQIILNEVLAKREIDLELKKFYWDNVVETSPRVYSFSPVKDVSLKYRNLLEKVDFSASEGVRKRINLCSKLTGVLYQEIKESSPSLGRKDSDALVVLKTFSNKCAFFRDKNWISPELRTNKGPSREILRNKILLQGSPYAIKDHKSRKIYFNYDDERRKESYLDEQQRALSQAREQLIRILGQLIAPKGKPGWTREELMNQFATEEEFKLLLDAELKKNGY